ncbi:hypothetical protein [Roseovarius nubinhibens]|uniref:hypothetical protein n=1 Tax=Roseovarius nubinhibens TaxID=314263 RepID=UPI001C30925D|nr:hypothetical protein [Roseovarius nubinhibens]
MSATSAPRRAASGWHPGWLFRDGAQGAWFDPTDATSLFQDANGTTPVLNDGDPVGLMMDISGNGNHATQSTSAARPSWRTDGNLCWLEFDGADDKLVIAPIAYSGSEFGLSIGLRHEPGDTKFGAWRALHVDGVYLGLSQPTSPGAIQNISGQLSVDGAAAPATRSGLRSQLLSPAVGIATGVPVSAFAGSNWQFGGYSVPAAPACRVYGYLESEALMPATRSHTRRWMAQKSGAPV